MGLERGPMGWGAGYRGIAFFIMFGPRGLEGFS